MQQLDSLLGATVADQQPAEQRRGEGDIAARRCGGATRRVYRRSLKLMPREAETKAHHGDVCCRWTGYL